MNEVLERILEEAGGLEALHRQVEEILAGLDEPERTVIQRRYGLVDGHQWSVSEVAVLVEMPCDQVLELEASGLAKIRSRPGEA